MPGSSLEGQHWTTQVFDYSAGGGPGGGAWRPGLLRAFLLRSGQSSQATIGGAQKVALPAEGWEPCPWKQARCGCSEMCRREWLYCPASGGPAWSQG